MALPVPAPSQESQQRKSHLPTDQMSETGGVDPELFYSGLADKLSPARLVLKKYYRQSDCGGPAQPIHLGQAKILVRFRFIVGKAAS